VLNVGFWTDPRRSDFKDTSSVRLAVVEALRTAGASLPDPEHWRSDADASARPRPDG
jgi:hypothetical protein